MLFTVELPDNAKNVKVEVLCDGEKYVCQESRYRPGYWNGLNGGMNYGQYFLMDDEKRILEMTKVASVLNEYGIRYQLTKFKRQYRIMISKRDYLHMDKSAKEKIFNINTYYNKMRELDGETV